VAALGLTRILVSFLVGVSSYDPVTYAVVATALITAAVVACYIPAQRAVRIDPMDALRTE
jgi:putative ABC transport system permease protein